MDLYSWCKSSKVVFGMGFEFKVLCPLLNLLNRPSVYSIFISERKDWFDYFSLHCVYCLLFVIVWDIVFFSDPPEQWVKVLLCYSPTVLTSTSTWTNQVGVKRSDQTRVGFRQYVQCHWIMNGLKKKTPVSRTVCIDPREVPRVMLVMPLILHPSVHMLKGGERVGLVLLWALLKCDPFSWKGSCVNVITSEILATQYTECNLLWIIWILNKLKEKKSSQMMSSEQSSGGHNYCPWLLCPWPGTSPLVSSPVM